MVGLHLVDYLLDKTDWDIYDCCGTTRWTIRTSYAKDNEKDRVHLVYGDINDLSSLLVAFSNVKPDYVFHLAAQSYPKTSFESPETLETNILGTAKVLDAIKHLGLDPVIHVCASSEVFAEFQRNYCLFTKTLGFIPRLHMISWEIYWQIYAEAYGLKVMTTRMFTHTGPRRGDVFAESTFAKQIAMIEAGLKSQ